MFDDTDCDVVEDYEPIIAFKSLSLKPEVGDSDILFGQLNAEPDWVLEDEGPKSFEGDESCIDFLFQTTVDYEFETVPNAVGQMEETFEPGKGAAPSPYPEYSLFVANELYFFGIKDGDNSHIYVVPQSI